MHYRKVNKVKLLLMLVALLASFAIIIGVTFSWIEGGATYTIQSDDENEPIKTDTVPENVTYSGKITLNPSTSSGIIELINYDENTNQYQDLVFSPVNSADGENFLFPVSNNDGTTAFYRKATVNDIGTKYINYDFEIAGATKKCYIAFDGEPSITAKIGNTNIDTSAFRIMIKCGEGEDDKYIFTTAGTNKTTTVATGTGSTVQTLTAVPFTNYLNNPTTKANKLFTYDKGATGNIEVSVWLDDGSDTSALQGCEITIDLNLIVVAEDLKATFNAVTYNKTGTKLSNGFTGGSIKYGSTSYTQSFYKTGTSFTATAVPNSNYEFIGWYSDAACTKLVSDKAVLPTQTPDDDVTFYAKFQERNSTVIYVEPRSGFTTYSVYAYNDNDYGADTHHYTDTWPGSSATLDANTGYYKLEFKTTDIGKFYVIISNDGAESGRYPAADVEGLEGDIGGTYLFTADNTLIEFDPADMITINAHGKAPGGSASVDSKSTVITRAGKTVALKATPDSGYRFVGWYKDSAYTTTIGTNYTVASQNITLTTSDAGNTLNYYAKFEKIPTLTLKTSVTPSGGGTAYAGGKTTSTVQIGSSVTLTASPASGYRFAGWYTNSACTSTTGITNPTSATSAKYTVSGTADSTVTLYAKFIKTYTVSAVAGTGGTVTVDKSTVDTGGSAKFTATANSGYEFVGWYTASTGGTLKSSDNPYTLTGITANTTLYARFEQTDITIYFTNNYSWSGTIYCHYWGGSESSTWPGVAMTYVGLNEYNQKQYKITIPADTTGIIFDNNSVQTGNITSNIVDGKGFYISGGSGNNHTVGTFDYE